MLAGNVRNERAIFDREATKFSCAGHRALGMGCWARGDEHLPLRRQRAKDARSRSHAALVGRTVGSMFEYFVDP